MHRRRANTLYCIATSLLLTTTAADAATILVSRDSELNGSYLFGAGSDTTTGEVQDSETAIDQRPSLSISDQAEDNGTAGGQAWTASASVSAEHQFLLDAAGSSLLGISSSGSSNATTTTSGPAVATADVRNPGNKLALVFSVDVPTAYELAVTTSDSDSGSNLGSVQLQRGNGTLWATFVGSSDETAFYTGELRTGLYRIVADARAEANGSSGNGFGSWNYDLSLSPVVIPVPSAAWLFVSGLGVLWLRVARLRRA